jgi:transposase
MTHFSMKTAGIDTSKAELHVCLLPGKQRFAVSNDAAGIALLVQRCLAAGVERCAIEATSIYHKPAYFALKAAGLETAEVQPLQVRRFAEALLKHAKSDPIDAEVIARFAQVLETVPAGSDEKMAGFAEHLTYIEQLEERAAWLKTALERFSDARIRRQQTAEIKRLEKARRRELLSLEAKLRRNQALAAKIDLLISIPGVAERTAIGFLVRMPELGRLTRGQAARLAGLAPLNDDTGQHKGERHIHGGRTRLRQTAYMAAFSAASNWNVDLKRFYARLRGKNLAHKSATVACARKLIILANAIIARGTPWTDKRVMP